MIHPFLSPGVFESTFDSVLHLDRSEADVEGGLFEQGEEKRLETAAQVEFGKLGGDSKGRDFTKAGIIFAVPKETQGEGREPGRPVEADRLTFRSSLDRLPRLVPVVGGLATESRAGWDLEGLGFLGSVDKGFGLQGNKLVEGDPSLEKPGLRVSGVRARKSRVFE